MPVLAVSFDVGAQPAGKVYRIGILGDKASDASESHLWNVFRLALREHGWNEGANLLIEYRWIKGNAARLPELAADLVRRKPDVLATRGSLFGPKGLARASRGASDEPRARHQRSDGEGDRPDDPRLRARARGSDHRLTPRDRVL
jgi:hypothetical protein